MKKFEEIKEKLKDSMTINGVIQKSGIYLMESGEVNTVMHVDFAV